MARTILAALLGALSTLVPSGSAATTASVCGGRAGTPPATVSHVIWIWFENKAAGQILGSAQAPGLNALARSCGLARSYFAVAHPSLPNDLAATSGSTQGVRDDGLPSEHPLRAVSLFEQARTAGSFAESMPGRCATAPAGTYAPKHNPEVYYLRVRKRCAAGDVPLGTASRGALATALRDGTLPAFSFVVPNLCHIMHDCGVGAGDAWLGPWLETITSSADYRAGRMVVFVAWDEDDGSAGNRVPLIVVSPWTTPGARSTARFTHYSLLRTTEELLGIRVHLGAAARAPSMRRAFGLG